MDKKEKFDSLFRCTYPRLLFYARGIVGDSGDAEDVVGEVFCQLWGRIDQVDLEGNIQSLLYRAVFTRAINLLKRRGVRQSRIAALSELNALRMELMESHTPSPHQDMEAADLHRQLDAAIDELPAKCRQVFRMSYIDGKRNADIAQEMHTSLRTVEAHMYNALKHLRQRLAHIAF